MQPHSMCALALSYYTWINKAEYSSCRLRVRYRNKFGEKTNYYDLKEIDHSGRNLSSYIIRSGGGLACTITAKIDSYDKVEMTHSIQHVAGLTEIFTLRKGEIIGGYHRNSKMYRNFYGSVKTDETTIELKCEILDKSEKNFIKVDYELSIDSKQLKK